MSGKERWRVIKYFFIASSAGIIELVSFSLLDTGTHWNYWGCYLIALLLSVLWNFTLNRKYTFRSNNAVGLAMVKVALYYMVFTLVSTLAGNYLAEVLLWNVYLVTLLNMGCNGITEYLYQRFIVFGKSIDTTQLVNPPLAKAGE